MSESSNSRMDAEFEDREPFGSLAEVQLLAADFTRYRNTERPHSSLRCQTPFEFAASLASGSAPPLRPTPTRHKTQSTLI